MKLNAAISKVYQQWVLRFWIRDFVMLLLSAIVVSPWIDSVVLLVAIALGIRTIVSFFLRDKPNREEAISLLNHQFPELEFSAKLIEGKELKGLAALQQKKIEKRLDAAVKGFKYPVNWTLLFLWIIAGGMSFLIKQVPNGTQETTAEQVQIVNAHEASDRALIPELINLRSIKPDIQPPGYTRLKAYISDADIRMPEGSEVTWSMDFSGVPASAFLHFSNGDSLALLWNEKIRSVRSQNLDQGFYWVTYFDGITEQRTPYYKIEVVPDEPPVVEISGIAQYQELPFSAEASLTFEASVLDDYGLNDASIVATVTKGEGESVKFREERLSFQSEVSGKQFSESMTLNASDFGMEPGNELYFYLEASDNKEPASQSNRTETYFFVLEDTANVEFSLVGSLGVDLMPEYFRSQRQIIIDTEKLLAEKDDISIEAFKARSNALGFDQKTLRIKYGQFLGEEAESGIAIENEIDADELEELDQKQNPRRMREEHDHKPGENVLKEFGHDHDHEDEEGQLLDKGTEQLTEAEKAIEEIAHNHDDAETATFYEVSLRTKLKTALSEMWDSELYLRLYEPEKSLPYQYAALKLLKEIKNHARIYVQRIGFDPPPITEDGKRLTGDMDEINAQNFDANAADSMAFPAIRAAIFQLGPLTAVKDSVPNHFQEVLQQAGNELAAEAIRYPSKYLEELGMISRLIKMESFDQEALSEIEQLKQVFLSLLDAEEVPVPNRASSHPLTQRVREKLSMQSSRP
ncbi:MAG: hypothetical protein R8G66_33640 [Cytophagales bacterium]|nr:hypothetical protein [Cytophagales bacterium]